MYILHLIMATHSDMMMMKIRFRFFVWVKMKLEQQNELFYISLFY